jgi:CubicO group peptidase (beta-lactamase class C family)
MLPIVLFAACAYVHCAPSAVAPRSAIEDDLPAPDARLGVAEAPGSIDELKQRIAAVLDREHVAGAAVAIVDREGPVWIGGLGVRDRATRAPVDADTAFRVGSLTKSVIALGVMRLADQGKLDIDQPLRALLPDIGIDNPWEDVAPVTLAQCLEHTAGFDDVRFNEIFTIDEQLPVSATLALNPRSRRVRWSPRARSRSPAASRSMSTCGARSSCRSASPTRRSSARACSHRASPPAT